MTILRAVAALAFGGLCQPALAAEAAKPQVMLVGTYHFSSPGKDIHNVKAVDVLAAESRNEVVQLGFRLARERGLQTVHGLDVAGDFPFEAIVAWAQEHGRASEIDAMMGSARACCRRFSPAIVWSCSTVRATSICYSNVCGSSRTCSSSLR